MELVVARFLEAGQLDLTFGSAGIVRTDIVESDPDLAMDVRVDPTGRITVVAGRNALWVARYLDNGEPDAGFAPGGLVTRPFFSSVTSFGDSFLLGVTIDDRPPVIERDAVGILSPFAPTIVAVGAVRGVQNRQLLAVARYSVGGELDPTFGAGGEVVTKLELGGLVRSYADSVSIDAAGRIVAAGGVGDFLNHQIAVARFLSDGSPDTTFNESGVVLTSFPEGTGDAEAVVITEGSKVVTAGLLDVGDFDPFEFALVRYLPDGRLDPTFGEGGRVRTTFEIPSAQAFAASVDRKNRIVAAGRVGPVWSQSDGVGGLFALARYRSANGDPDLDFGTDGKVTVDFDRPPSEVLALTTDSSDRLIAVGHAAFHVALARLREDGSLDPMFGSGGKVRLKITEGHHGSAALAVTLDEQHRVVVAGVTFPRGGRQPMPKVTAIATIKDDNQLIPDEFGASDIHFFPFDLPGLSGHGVLLFRLRSSGHSTFQVALNNAPTLAFKLDSSAPRSFHEIYPLSTLREENNDLSMAVTPVDGEELGSVTVSDVIVLYQVTI